MRRLGWFRVPTAVMALGIGGWVGLGCAEDHRDLAGDPARDVRTGPGSGQAGGMGITPEGNPGNVPVANGIGNNAGTGAATVSQGLPPGSATLTEAQVIGAAAELSGGVIEASELAAIAADRAIQDYAVRMVSEHGLAMRRLEQLSHHMSTDPVESELSRMLAKDSESTEAFLLTHTSAAFLDAYVNSQIRMQLQALRVLDEHLIPSSPTPELRAELLLWRAAAIRHLADAQVLPRTGGA
jgi:predicted outer membrane protein